MTNNILIEEEINSQATKGVLLVLTGPSGAGKDTVLLELVKNNPHIVKIITTTSRPKRAKESEGDPYYFMTREKFENLIAEGEFFEWVEFRGELYGTQKKTLTEALAKGVDVIWRIEAKGVKNIKSRIQEMVPRSVFVFLTAPDIDVMKQRVMRDEGEIGVAKRWNEPLVVWEMKQYEDCDYLVVNNQDNLPATIKNIQAIIEAKRQAILR